MSVCLSSQSVTDWSIKDVQTWIVAVGLDFYAANFNTEKIDGSRLNSLREADLKVLVVDIRDITWMGFL